MKKKVLKSCKHSWPDFSGFMSPGVAIWTIFEFLGELVISNSYQAFT